MMPSLYEETRQIWRESNVEARAAGWAKGLINARTVVETYRRTFHAWQPLRPYITLGDAKRKSPEFSWRFRGQEVARMRVALLDAAKRGTLLIDEGTAAANHRDFGPCIFKPQFTWQGKEGTRFRKHFAGLAQVDDPTRPRSEHEIEAWMLQEMAKETGDKFGGVLTDIQPVEIGRLPFQCPVPISANTGRPKASPGHIDIVARRGRGRPAISVWELKKPDALSHALSQAYIYAVTLALMLRSEQGLTWYQAFGFGGKDVPKKLQLEIVVAISKSQLGRLEQEARAFAEPMTLVDERAVIRPHVAIYDPVGPKLVDFKELATQARPYGIPTVGEAPQCVTS